MRLFGAIACVLLLGGVSALDAQPTAQSTSTGVFTEEQAKEVKSRTRSIVPAAMARFAQHRS